MYDLGACCKNGTGVPQDWAAAVTWYQRASAAGVPHAMCMMGICYEDLALVLKRTVRQPSHGTSVRQTLGTLPRHAVWVGATRMALASPPKEYGLRRCAAIETQPIWANRTPCASWAIASRTVTASTRDAAAAVDWYRRAADLGNAGAMYNLGLCYENGVGVSETSAAIAASWYERAAAAGRLGMRCGAWLPARARLRFRVRLLMMTRRIELIQIAGADALVFELQFWRFFDGRESTSNCESCEVKNERSICKSCHDVKLYEM
jgi:TPR repeat protein